MVAQINIIWLKLKAEGEGEGHITLSTMFKRRVSDFITEHTLRSRYYHLIGKVIHPRHQPCLFLHTQTVLWKKTDNEDVQSCQLLDFRPSDSSKTRKPLQALTVNDTTSGKVAYRHLRDGRALVYTGGDYHNANQLLRAVKRKCSKPSSSPKSKRLAKQKEKQVGDTTQQNSESVTQQWTKQRKLQQQQAMVINKLLIQISVHENRPCDIAGLKRAPENVKDVLAFAFQNDNMDTNLNDIDSASSPPETSSCLLSLNDFLAMIGGFEWHRKGVYIHALQGFIYPHFGVFPPTRQDYIALLDNIKVDKAHEEPIRMLEVGVGTGVLSIFLLKEKRVDHVVGTDINPYAVACAQDNVQRWNFSDKVDLVQADLFPATATTTDTEESNSPKYDVLLFNPPWVPGTAATKLDQAVYDTDQNILRRFLDQAQHHVDEDGDVYLLLSNLGMLLGLFHEQDLYHMFREGNLHIVQVYTTTSKAELGKTRKKGRKQHADQLDGVQAARENEVVSLYHLRLIK